MAKKRKNTARKSIGGSAKRFHVLVVPDRALHPRSPSLSPGVSCTTTAPAADQAASSLPMDLDREEEEEEQVDSQGDDVCFSLSFQRRTLFVCSGVPSVLMATTYSLLVTVAVLSTVPHAFLAWPRSLLMTLAPTTTLALAVPIEARRSMYSTFLYETHWMLLTLLQGLFHQDGRPVFQEGMTLTSHNVTPTIRNRLRTPRLVIIEFVLEELFGVGSAGQMLYLSLVPNYTSDSRKNIRHESIKFDLNNANAFAKHKKAVSRKVKNLQQLYVFPSISAIAPSPYLPLAIPLIMQFLSSTPIQMIPPVISSSPPTMKIVRRLWPANLYP